MASDFRGRAARLTGRASYFVGLISVVFLFIAAVAQAASYVYDANGRLRAATTAGGTTSEYLYDALGNLHTVNSVSSGQLAIFSFIPNRGPAGTAVHLYGQGFSATGGANTVAFNGMASTTVTPISASELIATVPAGATNGTLSVTVGTTTVTSTDIVTGTVDSGGQAPTIASFSPITRLKKVDLPTFGRPTIATSGLVKPKTPRAFRK